MKYRLTINGRPRDVDADRDMPLLWVLRDVLSLTGTKYGCGQGLCGACTVLVDGSARRACLLPLGSVGERAVVTIEGLDATAKGSTLKAAFAEERTSQCGYCQAGQLMSAAALIERTPRPDDAAIDAALSGNLCRCGTYARIRRAVKRASRADDAATNLP